MDPGVEALTRDVTVTAARATAFATQNTVLSVGRMIKSPAMGALADSIGLRPLHLISAGGAAVSFLLFLRLFPKIETANAEKIGEDRES